MNLGTETITVGEVRRVVANYRQSVRPGEHLTLATVTCNSPVSTITQTALSPDELSVFFWVKASASVETFTCFLSVTTSDGQVLNDTVAIGVTLPQSYATLTPVQVSLINQTGPTGPPGTGGTGPTGPA